MEKYGKQLLVLFAVFAVVALSSTTFAQTSATATTPIVATKAESISINASGLTTFDLAALAPQTLTINSFWNLRPQRNSVAICVYMDPASGIMRGSDLSNSDVIDQTMVQARVGSGAFANINSGAGCAVATGSTVVNTYALTSQAQRKVPSTSPRTDTVGVQLNAVPATIQADTYSGQLTVVAYAL